MKSYYIFNFKINLESNLTTRVSNPQKRRRSNHFKISVEPNIKRDQVEGKFLKCLHLRISLLKNLFNNASY
jgi:hypothetical protein